MNNTEAILEVCVSPNRSDLFEIFKDIALNSGLEYSESSTMFMCDAVARSSNLISNNIRFVTALSTLASFLIQIQPTIQELIKANASKSITVSCRDRKIDIRGENDIKEVISLVKEFDCKSNSKHLTQNEGKVTK
ncbi:MAG: hypothetical protein KME01_04675 [Chroococcus sp. CMT-3BRIN-NPC107]|jgi:hypothetical protein|nr:hypothetical protein [Chroococcus sp. CMT-3BRIN-NPC107]